MRLLEEAGYVCFRSAGSHGAADITAVSADEVLFVQVKRSSTSPSPTEIADLKALIVPPNCRKVVHLWRPRQKFPEINNI